MLRGRTVQFVYLATAMRSWSNPVDYEPFGLE